MLTLLFSLLLAYFIGSLPYGLIFVKWFKGVDIRTVGSNNIGFTNVFRAGYKSIAYLTLFFDIGKGAIAVLVALLITGKASVVPLAAIFVTLGHIYPVWLKFKGGKGVASALGSIFVVNPSIGFIAMLIWLLVFYYKKLSSLSAICAMLFILFCGIAFGYSNSVYVTLALIIVPLIVLYKHQPNIVRLLNKTEEKLIK